MKLPKLHRYHNHDYVSFYPRFLSELIDLLITGSWFTATTWFLSKSTSESILSNSILALTLIVFPGIFLANIYRVFMLSEYGYTLGKLIVGIEVLDIHKQKISWKRAAFRELIGKVISAYPAWAGYFWISFDPKHRAWHDHFSGTYVYKRQARDLIPAMIIVGILIAAQIFMNYMSMTQLATLLPTLMTANY